MENQINLKHDWQKHHFSRNDKHYLKQSLQLQELPGTLNGVVFKYISDSKVQNKFWL